MAAVTGGNATLSARLGSKRIKRLLSVIFTVHLGLSFYATAEVHPYEQWAEEFGIDLEVSYDGTRLMDLLGNEFTATERRAPGKMYSEVKLEGTTTGVILREDLKKSYILIPSMGLYKEETLEGGLLQASNGMKFNKIEKVGPETINGHPSTKFNTEFEDNEGSGAGVMWITDSGVPMKMDMTYANSKFQGQTISMQFTELNLRPQDPKYFELPPGLKPLSMGGLGNIGDLMTMVTDGAQATMPENAPAQGSADTQPAATAISADAGLADEQQACLQAAAQQAVKKQEQEKQTKGFGRLMGSLARTASRFGLADLSDITKGIYDAEATADDASVIAEELGISVDDVERCRSPE
ncbi:MAG: hypothetical protein ACJAYC_000701 [Halieaceae bacterium]|jgi:hypothetical protein